MTALVIAEKPSVAQDIARALNVVGSNKDYFENAEYIITSAIGHLVEIYDPVSEESSWKLDSLPILPEKFAFRPIKSSNDRVKLIKRLEKKVDTIINACDAGREGELIFHNIVQYLDFKKPITRLWLQSMTKNAIIEAFKSLRKNEDLSNLREAAVARSQADWLVGINATRALTVINRTGRFHEVINTGRVQTPTLSLIVEREKLRRAHIPKPYWTMEVNVTTKDGDYVAKWMSDKKEDKAEKGLRRDRIWDEEKINKLKKMFANNEVEGIATEVSKEKTVSPPNLFDLNSLQREANKVHALTARSTLQIAQALYEKFKLITYPRTESKYLPSDYTKVSEDTLNSITTDSRADEDLRNLANKAISKINVVGKKIFDDKKVTDHFAIIPTGNTLNQELQEYEQKIYDLIMRRFISSFLDPAKVLETERKVIVDEERFIANGRVILEQGWYAASKQVKEDQILPKLDGDEEKVTLHSHKIESKETKPLGRYDDASLLAAMQGAHKFVKEEEETFQALKETGGLGTPATRAQIVEQLIKNGYLIRNKKEMVPTGKAFALMDILRLLKLYDLNQPNLTGQWEKTLRDIEEGTQVNDQFIEKISNFVKQICQSAQSFNADIQEETNIKSACPVCGSKLVDGFKHFKCEKCDYSIRKIMGGRILLASEVDKLIENKTIGEFDDFVSKGGNLFSASLTIDKEGKIEFKFPPRQTTTDDTPDTEKPEGLKPIGECPKCGGQVLIGEKQYRCVKTFNGSKDCTFKINREYCKRELTEEEARKMLTDGKSELLTEFTSKKGRPFNAFLYINKNGLVRFEFEKRERKAAKKKPVTASKEVSE